MNVIKPGAPIGALFVAAIGSTSAALVQAAPSSAADCHAIAASMERLACYDAVSGRAAEAPRGGTAAATAATASTTPVAAVDATKHAESGGTAPTKTSMIDNAWDFDPASAPFDIRFHNANYLLFGRYTDNVNNAPYLSLVQGTSRAESDLSNTEAKFQISFKARLWTTDDRRWGVWAAYTQQSQWQVYNGDTSRPFRENNYMPELIVSYRPDVDLGGGFNWRLLNFGYNHQSNGRSDLITNGTNNGLSRSWDRLFAEFGVERENLALFGTVWYRLPEDSNKDDNPDITDYYGYGKLSALYRWRGNTFSAAVRGNLGTGKGAVEANWFSPPLLGPLRGYVQVFSGYGESLIDYNWNQTTIGAGVAISDGL